MLPPHMPGQKGRADERAAAFALFLSSTPFRRWRLADILRTLTTIKVRDDDQFDERTLAAFKERICESRAQNWPNLEGDYLIETSDDDSDE
jgi:hypothetical protein